MPKELTKRELHWLAVALEAGYDTGFRSRNCPALLSLEHKKLIESNPCSGNGTGGGVYKQWRITQKGEELYILR